MAAAPATIADLASALKEIRREIPNLVQQQVANSIATSRVEISAEIQKALMEFNDGALKQIELQAAATKLAADAQQIEIWPTRQAGCQREGCRGRNGHQGRANGNKIQYGLFWRAHDQV